MAFSLYLSFSAMVIAAIVLLLTVDSACRWQNISEHLLIYLVLLEAAI